MSDGEYFNELNTSSMLQTVYIKLPERLHRKLVSLAHRTEAADLRRPLSADFVIFVEKESGIAKNPTYSKEALKKIATKAKGSERYPSRGMKQKVSSFATQAKNYDSVPQMQRNSTSRPPCSLDHILTVANSFCIKILTAPRCL